MFDDKLVAAGQNNIEGGFAATGKLLDEKRKMTAIFATSDSMALGAMEKLKQMGLKVPEDVAVVGFDDLKVGAVVEPKLTTVTRPMVLGSLVSSTASSLVIIFFLSTWKLGMFAGSDPVAMTKLSAERTFLLSVASSYTTMVLQLMNCAFPSIISTPLFSIRSCR